MSLTLKKIKNTSFNELYMRFLKNEDIDVGDYKKILTLAVLFLNFGDLHVKRLGYRLIVIYSNRTGNYIPLYDISINNGLYPITKYIDKNHISDNRNNFFAEIYSSNLELYKSGDKYLSGQQYSLNDFYFRQKEKDVSIVAPTSYGKTELIIETLREWKGKNVCVITPTKSLLAQTRRRIINAKIDGVDKIVIHPDMFNRNEKNCVSVLTQERLMSLLKNNPDFSFDCVIVDEAHEILGGTSRNEILASDIIVLKKRNENTVFKFLTPFIVDSKNLKIRYTDIDLSTFEIKEYVKTERIYLYDIRNKDGQYLYDQYFDEFIPCNETLVCLDSIDYIQKNSSNKNIIYFNKPTDIEQYAKEMIDKLPDIDESKELKEAIKHISQYIDPEYTMVKCLKKGIIYHHSGVPDTIRSYVEYLYASLPEIKYIITSSTLLEGVNIPATRLFILDNKKGMGYLSPSEFKNLSGRICRFGEIFNNEHGSLLLLEPEIHVIYDRFFGKRSNIKDYISSVMRVDKKRTDSIENVLMEEVNLDGKKEEKLKKATEFLENYENGTVKDYSERHIKTEVGKSCINNSASEIDIFSSEYELQKIISELLENNVIIDSSDKVVDLFCKVFLKFVISNNSNKNILRFKNPATQRYYKMFLYWRMENSTYNKMVFSIVKYWQTLLEEGKNTIVYVGRWGDTKQDGGYNPLWTDLKNKSKSELINLAIVRIKEEQDFIDNSLMKYVEICNDIGIIDEKLYLELKYGTVDENEIIFIRNGFSLSLAKVLMEKYNKFLRIDDAANTITINPALIGEMSNNNENLILINEAKNNIVV